MESTARGHDVIQLIEFNYGKQIKPLCKGEGTTLMIDFHSHILPGMDDGSKSVSESMDMLLASKEQGINTMIASSHYYQSRESIDEYLARREESFNKLLEKSYGFQIPKIHLGAEVAYFSGMSKMENLEQLKIQGTECILIEMPFTIWTSSNINEIYSIINNLSLTPILAHVERYPDFSANSSKLDDLVNIGAIFQMNGEFINSWKSKRRALKHLNNSDYFVLGSDSHNMDSRPPNLGETMQVIQKKLGSRRLQEIVEFGNSLLINEGK